MQRKKLLPTGPRVPSTAAAAPPPADESCSGLSRRCLLSSAAAAGLLNLLPLPSPAAAQTRTEPQFPNYFRWDQPIFPDVKPKFIMKVGHQGPPNVFVAGEHVQAVIMKNIVERATKGEVQVQIFAAGALGKAQEQLEQTRTGIVQACIQESAVPTLYKPIQVFSIPYVFRTHAVAWGVYDGAFAREFFNEMAERVGVMIVGVGENGGFRCFTNNKRPIREVADLKGLKIRTQEHEGQIAMMRAMGVAPTPIPWAELYTALQTGVVDGQENAVPTINLGKLQEVQAYLTLDNHIYGAHYFLVNYAWLRSLPAEYRDIVREAGRQGAVGSRGLNRILEWELLARLVGKFKEISVPTAVQMKGFEQAAQPAYLDWYHKNVDPQKKWSDKLLAATKEAEKAIWG